MALYRSISDSVSRDASLLFLLARTQFCFAGITMFYSQNPEFWRNYLNWLTIFVPEEVEPALKEGLKESRQIIAVVATHYLQWAYSKSAIQGRKVYNEIRRIPGVFAEPFVKLVIAEEKKVSSPIEELRQILDEATTNLPNSVGKSGFIGVSGRQRTLSHVAWRFYL